MSFLCLLVILGGQFPQPIKAIINFPCIIVYFFKCYSLTIQQFCQKNIDCHET